MCLPAGLGRAIEARWALTELGGFVNIVDGFLDDSLVGDCVAFRS